MADNTRIAQLSIGGHGALAKVIVDHDKALRTLNAEYGANSDAAKAAIAAMQPEYQAALNQAKAYDVAAAAKKHHTDASKVDLEAQNALFAAN